MRARMMLIMAVVMVAVVGYRLLSAAPAPTIAPLRMAAKPDANTPRHTVRFRPEVLDESYRFPTIETTSNANPARDLESAKRLRQDPAVTTDHDAQVRAAASLDCGHDDPLLGKDDPSLPLVNCGPKVFADFFGPTLFDGGMVADATYGPGGVLPDRWAVTVTFTAAGVKILAELPRKLVPVAMLFDGRLEASAGVPAKPAGKLEFSFDKEDDARQVAAIINNR